MNETEHITMPARMDSLTPAMSFVSSYTEKSGFDVKRTREIELCLEEILVNIIHYAYPEGPGDVNITCGMADGGTLVVEVTDRGLPFDILTVDDPNLAANMDERRIGGLGIFFVKQLMDDVQYRRENDKNVLRLSANRKKND